MTSPTISSYLYRQAILDKNHDLLGYTLSLVPNTPQKEVRAPLEAATDTEAMTEPLISSMFTEFGIADAVGRATIFLPVQHTELHATTWESLSSSGIVLAIQLTHTPSSRDIQRCQQLRTQGYKLALADYRGQYAEQALFNLIDFIRVKTTDFDTTRLRELLLPFVNLPVKLMAYEVNSVDERERCLRFGFSLFQGSYFFFPKEAIKRRLSASQTRLIQLINLVGKDVDTVVLEEAIKRESVLTVNLLNIVNSAAFGLPNRISSPREAIILLGRRQLQRWLQLLLMSPAVKSDAGYSVVLQMAAIRGRMMELLVSCNPDLNSNQTDKAFIAGIISLMPTALGVPYTEIFRQIALERDITQALLSHQGLLGKSLALIECFDAGDFAGCNAMLAKLSELNINAQEINACLVEALRWTNSVNEENT